MVIKVYLKFCNCTNKFEKHVTYSDLDILIIRIPNQEERKMKRLLTIFILVISLLVVGCSSFIPAEQQQEEMSPKGSGDNIIETEKDDAISTDGNTEGKETKSTEGQVDNNEADIRIDSGRFSGRADSNFIEIKLSGVPEEMSYRTFMLSEELKKDFDSLNFQIDEVVKFKYTVNEHDQGVIFDISRI